MGEKLQALQQDGHRLTSFPVDVTNAPAVIETAAAIESRFGSIDLAVFCAGIWQPMSVASMDPEKMRQVMDTNYFGMVNAVNAVLSGMKVRGSGHMVILGSVAGYRGLPTTAAYGPAKAALIHFAETLAIELRADGIDVTLVNPGFVDTPMSRVNNYRMPGLISADVAAEKMLAGILKRKPAVFLPLLFTTAMRLTNLLPYRLYHRLVSRITNRSRNR
ncbi:MAG: SDR family NAD(P)-dependent oxidoreductase [Hyphomicrobiales bacterium]|nr:SDR family NAD(P)-dependent oxidoreductase [Hyphomicrobiales bacterium]